MPGLGLQGAYGLEALDQLLLRRKAEKQLAEKLAFEQRRQLAQDAFERRKFEQGEEQDIARNFALQSVPGDPVTQDLGRILTRRGLGGMVRTIPGEAPSVLRPGEEGPPDIGTPEQTVSRGGERYLSARLAAQEREAARAEQREFQESQNQLYRRTADQLQAAANRDQTRPYFTPATEYDPQGRPIGNLTFNTRTGQFSPAQLPQAGHLKPPPGDLGKQSIVNETASDQLDRLEALFKPELVGPVAGRAYAVGQQVPGVPVNEDFANLDAATSAFTNSVIKAITGAQMSESEAQRIKRQIPLLTDKPEVWRAKARQTRLNLADLERRISVNKPLSGGSPSVGERRQFGNKIGEWDGRGWKEVR